MYKHCNPMSMFEYSKSMFHFSECISAEPFGPQKWFTYQNVGDFICSWYMRLFSNSNGVQVSYAPIFDGRLLLGMSLFSKKYNSLSVGRVWVNSVAVNKGSIWFSFLQCYLPFSRFFTQSHRCDNTQWTKWKCLQGPWQHIFIMQYKWDHIAVK